MGKVSVIPDEIEEISHEVKQFSFRYPVVITTGVIGLTMHGIA